MPGLQHDPMNSFGNFSGDPRRPGSFEAARIAHIATGLVAIAITFFAASSGTEGLTAFAVTAGAAALFLFASVFLRPGRIVTDAPEAVDQEPAPQAPYAIEDRLIALNEANEVFASSLNAADMFRLVSSRVAEIFPFAASLLAVPSADGESLRFVYADGANADALRDLEIGLNEGLAGRSFGTGKIVTEIGLSSDWKAIGSERLAGFAASAAIPLIQGESPFGVFQIFTNKPISSAPDNVKLLEAIGEHVTPIFRSSLAFERTLSSALTDNLTGLPNERAFYMVLENQLAESFRNREERPLTILSIDIRDFGAVNSMLGHGVGDQMLEFAGKHIGEHLRKMDFLARTINDEFSVILPTASKKTAFEIIERIREGFVQNEFEVADGEGVAIAVNVGWATFWKDGETVEQLIRAAQQRKRQAKSEEPAEVLWFPKEYVN